MLFEAVEHSGPAGDTVQRFLEDCPTHVAAMTEAAAHGDAPGLRRHAQALKTAAANFSATGLFEAASVVERLAADSRLEAAPSACRLLAAEAAQVLTVLGCSRATPATDETRRTA
jgi:HPt (histidine-containing phosphotransfer) domain-containing protein